MCLLTVSLLMLDADSVKSRDHVACPSSLASKRQSHGSHPIFLLLMQGLAGDQRAPVYKPLRKGGETSVAFPPQSKARQDARYNHANIQSKAPNTGK